MLDFPRWKVWLVSLTILAGILLALVAAAEADTDAADGNASIGGDVPRNLFLVFLFDRFIDASVLAVAALGNLYSSWNSPAQLAGWSAAGGDPCGAAWTGVSCWGSAVTSM